MPTFQPQCLQFGVVLRCKLVVLQEAVEFLEVAPVEGDHCLRLQHGFVQLQFITLGQGPQEATQSLDLAALLQHLAHACHLLLGEAETGQRLPAWRSVMCRCQHVSWAAAVVQTICIIRRATGECRCARQGTEGGQGRRRMGRRDSWGRGLSLWEV